MIDVTGSTKSSGEAGLRWQRARKKRERGEKTNAEGLRFNKFRRLTVSFEKNADLGSARTHRRGASKGGRDQ